MIVDPTGYLINGDNAEVLTALYSVCGPIVDCVYIDPPYNNGEEYSYYSDSFDHDKWISHMTQALVPIWQLLKTAGSLWISIDDSEMAYLKVLCDELFTPECYVATVVWQQRNTRENRNTFSHDHEYILVYAPDPKAFKRRRNLLPLTEEVLGRYKNPDDDPRGPWQSVSLNVQAGHAVPTQFYEITSPATGKVFSPPAGRCWIYNKEKMEQEIKLNNVWFGKDGNAVPRAKRFLKESKRGLVPGTLWLAEDVGTNQDAKKHLKKLFPKEAHPFDTPKPESLLKRILDIATDKGDVVLDAYLGSGTTAAVAHKMGRHYIGIERESGTCALAKSRMEQVVSGESGGISRVSKWRGGGSFDAIDFDGVQSLTGQLAAWSQKG